MSTETIEKKLYPSQVNSKTISARVPVQDYVKFLQESLSNNISLNDWLLLKIYNSESKMGDVVNTETEVIRINSSELNSYQYEFWKEDFDTNGYWDLNKEDVMDLMEMVRMKQLFIDKFNKELVTKKQPSITDVKVQIRALVRSKIHRGDQDDFLKEVNELLKELE
jgi:hypothetical protein